MKAAMQKSNSLDMTRMLRALGLAAVVAFAGPAHSQECSGGSGGGTDATGNQCNDPVAIAASGERPGIAVSVSAPETAHDSPTKRIAAGAANPAVDSDRASAAPISGMRVAAHRKQVFDERRARFNDSGHARVADAQPSGATGASRGAGTASGSSGNAPAP